MKRKRIQLFRTSGTTAPQTGALFSGELAISMDDTSPKIWFTKNNGEFAEFVDKSYIESHQVSYIIKYELEDTPCSNSATTIGYGESYTNVISLDDTDVNELKVMVGGIDTTQDSWDVLTKTVSVSSVTGNISISLDNSKATYYSITKGTCDGVIVDCPAQVKKGKALVLNLTMEDGYTLKEGGIYITEGGVEKEFVFTDNKITVSDVQGDIVYSIDSAAEFSVTCVFNNVTSSNSATTVDDQSEYTTTLSFDTTTFSSIDATVTMGGSDITNSCYNYDTHVITISKPTGNISIHAEATTTVITTYENQIDLTATEWKFNKLRDVSTETFDSSMVAKSYDDSSWDSVSVPHDWSIYNDFDTTTTGQEYESGWLAGGDAVYRTTFNVPSDYTGKKVYVHFDGVYMTSEIYINGTSVGTNKNGYIPFDFDITDYITPGEDNVLAVTVSNHIPSSRWYSGSGIFRNVWISMNNSKELGVQDVTITTPNLATQKTGTVATNVKVEIENAASSNITGVTVQADIYQDWDGVKVGTTTLDSQTLTANTLNELNIEVGVSSPTLWSTYDLATDVRVYKAIITVSYKNTVYTSNDYVFGYRYISYDADGFYLNGDKVFLKGMCNHHDLGPLGSETNESAIYRQLTMLKDSGCNTLRTTHAPQSSTFMNLAMRMGFMVVEELFDGWRYAKNSNTYDYARFFAANDSYKEIVIKNVIKRDKNNPAVIMWSLGNEVDEGCSTSFNAQYVTDGTLLNTYVKSYDSTRPTTFGNNKPDNTYAMQLMALVDVIGVNYGNDSEYSTLRAASSNGVSFSTKCIYGSETTSPFYTRGIYETSTANNYYNCFDYSNTEEANSHASWGDSSCVALKRHQETYTWLAGIMPWTGFDYIGEPTPSNNNTVRSSFFGIIDLCGFKKDAYYLYQAKWTDTPMIHIVPEDWTNHIESATTTVWVYSNCSSVKLHLNGTQISETTNPTTGSHYAYEYSVTFEKGTLVATGYDDDGNIVAQDVEYSAGAVKSLKLTSDKTTVAKDGSLIFVECDVVDAYTTIVPKAAETVTFTAVGGTVIATDNGFPGCFEKFRNTEQTTFTGKCIAIVKPDGTSSEVSITASVSNAITDSETITVTQGDSNVYYEEEQEFVDPTNPPIRASLKDIVLSKTSTHLDNGGSDTITVTLVPNVEGIEIEVSSNVDGITATVDNDAKVITVTNTVDDVKGIVTVECGGVTKKISVACGSEELSTISLSLNGSAYSETNKTVYKYEYIPYSVTSTGSDVKKVSVTSDNILTLDTTNNVLYGKEVGTSNVTVELEDGTTENFEITVSSWEGESGETITNATLQSISSNVFVDTITTYTTGETISGEVNIVISDKTLSQAYAVIEIPESVTLDTTTNTVVCEFGTDSTGTKKSYVVLFSGDAGSDLSYTLSIVDSENGRHKIGVRLTTSSNAWSYKIGTLSCTDIILDTTVINITSDETNNQKIGYTVIPSDTTDDVSWSVANNYTTCVGGSLFAIKNGTDTVTVTCGSISSAVTVNISGITEDETILAYEAKIDGEKQYYVGGSAGITWESGYTLYAELQVTDMSVSTANLMSFGSNISNWGGSHYHIYYPTTGNGTASAFPDTTTKGLCLAMAGGSSPSTNFVTATMMGTQSDTMYLVQNNNGLWINGVDATLCAVDTTSFDTIQSLTNVQIGSCEGSGRFTGVIKQLRLIKTEDLADGYSELGDTELEDISTNGLDKEKYLKIYSKQSGTIPQNLTDLNAMDVDDTMSVLLANPHVSNGYILGYSTTNVGYSNSRVSMTTGNGFADLNTLKDQADLLLADDDNKDYFIFTLTKTSDTTYTLALANGYGPTGTTGTITWSTTLMSYTISDLTDTPLASTASMMLNYAEEDCLRITNPSSYYINSQGTPSSLTFATGTGEWSVWYILKIRE